MPDIEMQEFFRTFRELQVATSCEIAVVLPTLPVTCLAYISCFSENDFQACVVRATQATKLSVFCVMSCVLRGCSERIARFSLQLQMKPEV